MSNCYKSQNKQTETNLNMLINYVQYLTDVRYEYDHLAVC